MMLNNFGRSGEQLVSCSVQLAKYSRRQQPDAQMASGKESRMLTAHSRNVSFMIICSCGTHGKYIGDQAMEDARGTY
jgi:hypothetical protein